MYKLKRNKTIYYYHSKAFRDKAAAAGTEYILFGHASIALDADTGALKKSRYSMEHICDIFMAAIAVPEDDPEILRKRKLLKRLWELKRGINRNDDAGICSNCDVEEDPSAELLLQQLFQQWAEFSGSLAYPVREHPHHVSCKEPFVDAEAYRNSKKYEGFAGSSRMRLINFCIRKLEEELYGR
jgi:hypothetical protein